MTFSSASADLYSVTELAEELGITPRAIRFYETKGLIKPRRAGTTRVYTYRDRARMQLILRGKRLGFSLADIKEYLDMYDVDPSRAKQVKLLLEKVDRRIGELEQQREDLETTLAELDEMRQQCVAKVEGATQ
ncbi:MAG: MerR family DNA-binding transcriptional regulator [Acidihalobacter sp.]|uniref:MerR family transcriptional regulator n=1 Tax=Acidihalobacter sp. TaxID=1872108 RepID=UPI00307E6ED6